MWCADGDRAADSQYLVAERVGRFKGDRCTLRSAALSIDSSVFTWVANDYRFGAIFARQIETPCRSGDVIMGIFTLVNSKNVLRALQSAKALGLHFIGLLGKDGGKAEAVVDHAIVIPQTRPHAFRRSTF